MYSNLDILLVLFDNILDSSPFNQFGRLVNEFISPLEKKISDQAAAAENQQRTKDDRKRNNKNKQSISSISSINISSTCCGSSEAMVHRAADHAETKRSKRLKFSLSSSLMYSRNHSLIVSSPFSSHFYYLDITIANRKSQASNIITKKPDNGLYQI